MHRFVFVAVLVSTLFLSSSCVCVKVNMNQAKSTVERPNIVPHSEWESEPPVGYEADAVRRNLAPGETFEFKGLVLSLLEMKGHSQGDKAKKDEVVLTLESSGKKESLTMTEGDAFNWNGFHIAIVAVHGRSDELGAGLTEFEVATLESVPDVIAKATEAGGAESRLRIPHEITMITLHHSGSAKPVTMQDDIPQKLRDLQAWGERDKNWWDVPYHYIIGPDGTIYEGRDHRFVGETNTKYDPTGHFLISVMGNYEIQEPTDAQIDAISDLMAWAVNEYGVSLEKIYGHGDLAETACPGKNLKKYLQDGTFLANVKKRLGQSD